MKTQRILLFVLIIILIVGSVAVTAAQSSSSLTNYVLPTSNSITFVGNQGDKQLSRIVTFVAIRKPLAEKLVQMDLL